MSELEERVDRVEAAVAAMQDEVASLKDVASRLEANVDLVLNYTREVAKKHAIKLHPEDPASSSNGHGGD